MMANKDLPSQISIKLFNRTRTFGTVAPQATFSTYTGQKHYLKHFTAQWLVCRLVQCLSTGCIVHPRAGPQPKKNFGNAEITFGNDYDVIDVQSNMMRPFCYDQLAH